jgi:glutathione S-transferase
LDILGIKLYHFPMSRSARVKWLLHELFENDFEVEVMALYEGQQYQKESLTRNPNHGVPVLEVSLSDGKVLTMFESGAMIALLADLYPSKSLVPEPHVFSPERADYLQMLHFGSTQVDMILWQIRLHRDLFGRAERDDRTISRYMDKFAQEIEPQLKARLATGGYICGASFTAADCVMGQNVMWARLYGLCAEEVFTAYVDRLLARPACQAAFADRDQVTISPPGRGD